MWLLTSWLAIDNYHVLVLFVDAPVDHPHFKGKGLPLVLSLFVVGCLACQQERWAESDSDAMVFGQRWREEGGGGLLNWLSGKRRTSWQCCWRQIQAQGAASSLPTYNHPPSYPL